MKKKGCVAACCLVALSVFGATKDDPSITVTGLAKTRAAADRAYVVFRFQETDSLSANAGRQAEQDMDRVLKSVEKKIKGDLLAQRMGSLVQKEEDESYTVSHTIWISSSPKDPAIFELIDEVCGVYGLLNSPPRVNRGLPSWPIIYAVEDFDKIEARLALRALEDARSRAEALAEQSGKTVGEVLSISTDLIPAAGRNLDLPTPYISNDRHGVMMVCSITVTYQLLPQDASDTAE